MFKSFKQYVREQGLAITAIVISAASLFISLKSYLQNVESFGFSSSFTYECPFSVGMIELKNASPKGSVGLCWEVTIANQSGARITVVNFNYSSTISSEGPPFEKEHTADVLDRKGHTLTTPVSFEGAEARTVVVRVSVPITDALWKLIDDAIKHHDMTGLDTLNNVASIAAQAKLDVLGNPVSVREIGDSVYALAFPSDYKETIVPFRVRTGRDNVFETKLIYPNGPINLLLRKQH
jgi:hypothetical protein